MKSKLFILVAATLLLAGTAVDDAGAGIFGGRDTNDDKEMKTYRYSRVPTMSFASGRMLKDTFTEWKLGDLQVVLSPHCTVIDSEGEEARIREGADVIVMGARAGNTIVAWQVRVEKPSFMQDLGSDRSHLRPSDVNPEVGELTKRSPL
jgi:hypothetical protein